MDNFNDIFVAFLGTGDNANGDCLQTITISTKEAVLGCEKILPYKVRKHCEKCDGTGIGTGGTACLCLKCNGEGQKTTQKKTIFGLYSSTKHCKKCSGIGKIITEPCDRCGGYGTYETQEQQCITIPANISENSISIKGKGHYVSANARSNLVVTVLVVDR